MSNDTQITEVLLEDIRTLRSELASLTTTITSLRGEMASMQAIQERHAGELKTVIENLKKESFVGGDMSAHRLAHEKDNKEAEEIREVKKAVITKILQGASWAAILGLGWAALQAVKDWLLFR
jgi:hypothetical protein